MKFRKLNQSNIRLRFRTSELMAMFDSGNVINRTRCLQAVIQHHCSPGDTNAVPPGDEFEKGSTDELDPSCKI